MVEIRALAAPDLAARLPEFGRLLHACVHGGASVGFVLPFDPAAAEAFWRDRVLPPLADGGRVLLAAFDGPALAGTVQLLHDTMPNQPHRAEVAKLLVDPARRREGIATALMLRLEDAARRLGRSLLTLDTRPGDGAEPLYAGLGYAVAGTIPDFCRDNFTDRLDPTRLMYKRL